MIRTAIKNHMIPEENFLQCLFFFFFLQYQQEYDEQELGAETERFCRRRRHSSDNGGENTLEQNSRRIYPYSENGENEASNRRSNIDRQVETMPAISPRTPYPPTNYPDERRESGLVYEEQQPQHQAYQDRRHPLESDQQLPKRSSASYQNNTIVDRVSSLNIHPRNPNSIKLFRSFARPNI